MSFWDRVVAETMPPQQPQRATGRAWWQEPDPIPSVQNHGGLQAQSSLSQPPLETRETRARQLMRMNSSEMSQEDMEFLAEFELERDKYHTMCPQCGSSNYVTAGTKLGGVTMPTEKCFECGLSARGPEPAVGAKGGSQGSIHTRQIDTGGASSSMYMRFTGVPSSYIPRS
jgi:hypothetical protein